MKTRSILIALAAVVATAAIASAQPAPPPEPAGSGSGSGSAAGSGSVAAPAPAGPVTPDGKPPTCTHYPDLLPWYEKLVCRPHDYEGNYWLPKGTNKYGDGVDSMFYATLALSAFFFIAITAFVVWATIKYRHRPGHKAEPSPSHNDALEITWTIIPTIICVFLFYFGWRGFIFMQTPPVKALEINVNAKQWVWSFTHSNGVTDSNLHVPANTPVRLVMTSQDVLHSFFVPGLRTKMDVIPRRYTYVWFEATKPGTYRLYCTEYCGLDHSQMKTKIVIHESLGFYERYLAEEYDRQNNLPPVELGAMLYEKRGCNACHSLDGSIKVGPSFKGAFGSTITTNKRGSIVVDENYLRGSILQPHSEARTDFVDRMGQMPVFEDQLKEREILGLIEFIKSQGGKP